MLTGPAVAHSVSLRYFQSALTMESLAIAVAVSSSQVQASSMAWKVMRRSSINLLIIVAFFQGTGFLPPYYAGRSPISEGQHKTTIE